MHGDGPGMPVGEADEEHYFSPTNNSPAAGSGASGSPASGGTLQSEQQRPLRPAAPGATATRPGTAAELMGGWSQEDLLGASQG